MTVSHILDEYSYPEFIKYVMIQMYLISKIEKDK
jgi:hypothetical protein